MKPSAGGYPVSKCQAYQSGDSTYCGACALQWDTNDPEPPQCTSATVSARAADVARLRKRFELLAATERWSVAKNGGEYFDIATRKAWKAFQAGYSLPR